MNDTYKEDQRLIAKLLDLVEALTDYAESSTLEDDPLPDFVLEAREILDERRPVDDEGGDTDDAYALASAGRGTDEDYGYYPDAEP